MNRAEDFNLIEECLSRLERQGFRPEVLAPIGVQAIRQAAFRLAAGMIDVASVDLAHPLGFGRVPLTPWNLGRPRAAVHIWDCEATAAISEDVHDHCYDFVSVCCAGGLEHRVFRLRKSTDGLLNARALIYSAGSCDAAGSETEGTDLGVEEIDCFVVEAPRVYAMGSEILHSARPTSELTVTVQFQSPIMKFQARVYRPGAHPKGLSSSASMPFTAERVARALAEWR